MRQAARAREPRARRRWGVKEKSEHKVRTLKGDKTVIVLRVRQGLQSKTQG